MATSIPDGALTPPAILDGRGPGAADLEHLLQHGELHLDGRLVDSSNNAMVGTVSHGSDLVRCVYKPLRGERPLWDFPNGSLAAREVAAYHVSKAGGWDCVPVTVMRDGDYGPGMVQQWIADGDADGVVNVFPAGAVPDGWLPVFAAQDAAGAPLVVAHAQDPHLAVLAAFDAVVNNADRKGSHLLPDGRHHLYGVDHGLTFHTDPKLRTVLWGWAGQPLPTTAVAGLERLADGLESDWRRELSQLVTAAEVDAFEQRVRQLRARPSYPLPPADRTPIPWPPL